MTLGVYKRSVYSSTSGIFFTPGSSHFVFSFHCYDLSSCSIQPLRNNKDIFSLYLKQGSLAFSEAFVTNILAFLGSKLLPLGLVKEFFPN